MKIKLGARKVLPSVLLALALCITGALSVAAAPPAGNLDQWANLPTAQWQNGNLNAQQALYREGDSVPYRLRLTDLAAGPHTVIIEWDTTQGGDHALDYLTTYNRTVNVDPCSNAGFACGGATSTLPIPTDPNVTSGGVTPVSGNFTLFGGTLDSASAYTLDGAYTGNSATRIAINFTSTAATPNLVLAWGGHIATRADWGMNNSAVDISGSPYHMRFIDLDGKGGNQDRSLSAEAVIFPGSITIVKDATPNGATSFPFTASPAPLTNFSLVDDGSNANTKVFSGITSFTTYTVAESAVAGWTLASINCTVTAANGGSQTANIGARTASINLREGENVTCTFANQQQAGTLIVKKVVTNDNGGTLKPENFSFSVNGAAAVPFEADGQNDLTVSAGTYNVTEPQVPAGYAVSSNTCTNIVVPSGGSASCTITNDDILPKLKLDKVVTNDNGGTAVKTDWALTATGPTPISGNGGAMSNGTFKAGTYTLSETDGPGGYTASGWSCTGGSQSGSQITVNPGDDVTCTIVNDDKAPSLTLMKSVKNDNGGKAAPAEWTLRADGGLTPFSGTSGVVSGATFKAGTYTLSETDGPSGYTPGAWSCVGGTQNGSQITLALGQSATCTITNDDIQPKLTVTKIVKNDNGGGKQVSDFPLLVGSTSVTSGVQNGFNAGTYTVSETQQAGYTATIGGNCSPEGIITLNPGDVKSCTITNDDIAPKLKLVKQLIKNNGGTALITDWTLRADTGPTPFNGTSGVASPADFNAGTYTLSETGGPSGYTESGWACIGGSQNGSQITLKPGDDVTCTITNDDQAATLIVKKVVVNNSWTTKTAGAFSFKLNGGADTAFVEVADGDANPLTGQTTLSLGPGTYTVTEVPDPQYSTAKEGSCTGITLLNGGSATCTITNTGLAPALTLAKSASPAQYDTLAQTINYSYLLTNDGAVSIAGPFTVSDDKATVSCPNTASLAVGSSITCSASYVIAQADLDSGSVTNIATGFGSFNGKTVTSNQDSETVRATTGPQLSLVKTASPAQYDTLAQTINYSYALSNIGNVTLSGPFTVDDDKATVSCPNTASLAVGSSITCSASYVIAQADLDSGSVTNFAQGHAFFGATPVDSNRDNETVTAIQKPALLLAKSATPSTYDTLNQTINYGYRVENTGNVRLPGPVTVSDDKATVVCPSVTTVGNADGFLDTGESINCAASYSITQTDLDSGSVTNLAKASVGGTDSNQDTKTVNADQKPGLALEKRVSTSAGGPWAASVNVNAPSTVYYQFTITNSGNITISGPFTVIDATLTAKGVTVSCPSSPTSLAPNGTIICTANYTLTQTDVNNGGFMNAATATGRVGEQTITSNESKAEVTAVIGPHITVVKTANPTTFSKVGDVINYTLVGTNDGNVTLTSVSISDPKLPSLTCDKAAPVTLAPGEKLTCTGSYSITQADLDAKRVENAGTATGNPPTGNPVTSTDTETTTGGSTPPPGPTQEQPQLGNYQPWTPSPTPVPASAPAPAPTSAPAPPQPTAVPPTPVPPTATPVVLASAPPEIPQEPAIEPEPEPIVPQALPNAGLPAGSQEDGIVLLAIAGMALLFSGYAVRRRLS